MAMSLNEPEKPFNFNILTKMWGKVNTKGEGALPNADV
jgi:hypothetical protein